MASAAGRRHGFTLIEVLVAVAIIAFIMTALMGRVWQSVADSTASRDRTFGALIARNVVIEYQTGNPWPEPGRADGDTDMAGREWTWEAAVIETQDDNIRRLNVEVYAPLPENARNREPKVVGRVSAFLPNPNPSIVQPRPQT